MVAFLLLSSDTFFILGKNFSILVDTRGDTFFLLAYSFKASKRAGSVIGLPSKSGYILKNAEAFGPIVFI